MVILVASVCSGRRGEVASRYPPLVECSEAVGGGVGVVGGGGGGGAVRGLGRGRGRGGADGGGAVSVGVEAGGGLVVCRAPDRGNPTVAPSFIKHSKVMLILFTSVYLFDNSVMLVELRNIKCDDSYLSFPAIGF